MSRASQAAALLAAGAIAALADPAARPGGRPCGGGARRPRTPIDILGPLPA